MVKRKRKTRRIKYKRKRKRATKKYRKHKRRVRTRIHRRITKKHRGGVKVPSKSFFPKRRTLFSKRRIPRGLAKAWRKQRILPEQMKAAAEAAERQSVPAQDARMDALAGMDLAAQPLPELPVQEAKGNPLSPVPAPNHPPRKRAWGAVRSVAPVKADPEETIQQLKSELEECNRILNNMCPRLGIIGSDKDAAQMDIVLPGVPEHKGVL